MEQTLTNLLAQVPFIGPALRVVLSILVVVITACLDAEVRNGTGDGAAKKAQVVTKVNALIAEPGGIDWPSWLPQSLQPFLVNTLLELVVFILNKTGLFSASKT